MDVVAEVRTRTGREPAQPLFYFSMSRPAYEGARSIALFLLVLLLVDALVIGVIVGPRLAKGSDVAAVEPRPDAVPGATAPALTEEERGWALCQTRYGDQDVTPTTIAITYLDPSLDEGLGPEAVRGWFGDVPARAIEVYKLEDKAGKRRISFELPRRAWSDWETIAAGAGVELACARLRTALRARSIGRPGLKPSDAEASRYDFEFLHARRVDRYRTIQLVGNLDRALAPKRFEDLQAWLAEGG
jgi:hypothetical protein